MTVLPMTIAPKFILAGLALALAMTVSSPAARATEDARFEIVKATDTRVWRLDKQSGEIAVCTLEGENLFCTTTSAAVDAPQMTYEEWDAKKKLEQAEADAERKAERERNLAFFDKMLDLFRSFMHAEAE